MFSARASEKWRVRGRGGGDLRSPRAGVRGRGRVWFAVEVDPEVMEEFPRTRDPKHSEALASDDAVTPVTGESEVSMTMVWGCVTEARGGGVTCHRCGGHRARG